MAAAIFLGAAGALSLVVTQVLATNALDSEQVSIKVALANAASQITDGSSAYNALLDNTFSVPSPCSDTNTTGTGATSCLSVGANTWTADWGVAIGTDQAGTSAATASWVTLTGHVVLPNASVVSMSQVVDAPSFAYSQGEGVVRVNVSDPGSLMSGPVYLLSMANPSTVITSAPVTNGVAVLRANAASCIITSPCVLGLSAGNEYGQNGTAAMSAGEFTGGSADVVLTGGAVQDAELVVRGIGALNLRLDSTNTSTGQVGSAVEAGSVCLYANFNDGVANQSVPICNFSDPGTISLSDYAPDPSRPNVELPFPVNTPITITSDPASGTCPWVSNPSGGAGLVGWDGTGWVSASSGVCSSWTWGEPDSLSVSGTTTSWANAPAITLVAGTTQAGSVNWTGTGNAADVVVGDSSTGSMRLLTQSGITTTLANSGLGDPRGIAEASNGTLYVADAADNVIDQVSATGQVTTLAGNGTAGYADGSSGSSEFHSPRGLTLSASGGTLYVADAGNNLIRAINLSTDVVSTVADTGVSLKSPEGVAVSGNTLYVADTGNNRVVEISGGSGSLLAGSGVSGYSNGIGAAASFSAPQGVAIGGGTLYVADTGNDDIRVVNTTTGSVSTLAGTGSSGSANGTGASASFSSPRSIALSASGTLFVADAGNNLVREVSPGGSVTTLAGSGGSTDVNGTGVGASFAAPVVVAGLGGWQSDQPAVGFGDVGVWAMPRDLQYCSGTGCTSLGSSVPENTQCPGSACESADVAYLTGPEVGGMNTVVVSGSVGTTVNFSLNVADYFGHAVSVSVASLPSQGTLRTTGGVAITSGETIATTPGGGGLVPLKWVEGSSGITQTSFVVSLNNGLTTVNYPIGFYRSVGAWQMYGYNSTVSQGGSTTLSDLVVNTDGSLATSDSITYSCSTCAAAGITVSPATISSESAGTATTTVDVSSSAGAGEYAITATSSGHSVISILTVSPVAAVLYLSLSANSVSQGGSITASASVADGSGAPMSGVDVSVQAFQGASVAPGVYAPTGGCVSGVSGTCSVTFTIENEAASGNYVIKASSGSLSSTSSCTPSSLCTLAVSQSAASIVVGGVNAIAGGAGVQVPIQILDGAGVPIPGATVVISQNSYITVTSDILTTNADGVATATISVPATTPSGNYALFATASGAAAQLVVVVSG